MGGESRQSQTGSGSGVNRRGTNPELQEPCGRSLMPAPHLFLQTVPCSLEQLHDLPDEFFLCKRVRVPPLLSTLAVFGSGPPV